MANELSLNLSFAASKNGADINFSKTIVGSMAGTKMIQNVQIVGTSAESIVLGDNPNPQVIILYNLDPTNWVDYSEDGSVYLHRLKPGGFPLFVVPNATDTPAGTRKLIADTAACRVLVIAIGL